MDAMETGLRHRLQRAARQIESQHQLMKPIHAELENALEHGSVERVREWMQRYREALEAHFELEDEVVFPAMLGYRPAWQARLSQLLLEHDRFRSELREIEQALDHVFGESVARRVADLKRALAAHERQEEDLVGSVLEIGSGGGSRS
jgi:hemerythrin-like domain-containing protein